MKKIIGIGGRYEVLAHEGGAWHKQSEYNWFGLKNYLEAITSDEDFILGEGLTLAETNKLVKIIVK